MQWVKCGNRVKIRSISVNSDLSKLNFYLKWNVPHLISALYQMHSNILFSAKHLCLCSPFIYVSCCKPGLVNARSSLYLFCKPDFSFNIIIIYLLLNSARSTNRTSLILWCSAVHHQTNKTNRYNIML